MLYNKNGIRILDPKANNLPKQCHASMHVWVEDVSRASSTQVQEVDLNETVEITNSPIVCSTCGKKDVETNTKEF